MVVAWAEGLTRGREDDLPDAVMKNAYCVVLVTAKDKQEASKIAKALLDDRLIACANIISGVHSIFLWQGKIDSSGEVLLVMKTKQGAFAKLVKKVKALHSYEVPEIIALPIVAGEKNYLKWIKESVC